MGLFLFAAACGLLLLPVLPALPPLSLVWLLALLLALLLRRWQRPRESWLPLLFAATFSWSLLAAQQALEMRLPGALEGRPLQVQGRITGLPEPAWRGQRFRFQPQSLRPEEKSPAVAGQWQLFTAQPLLLQPDAECRLSVRLKRPHGVASPGGFDYEAWLLSEGVTATGSATIVQCSAAPAGLDGLRHSLRLFFQQHFAGAAEAGVMLALVSGDRALIPDALWESYTATGVVHLMAISGLHITLLALVAAWLLRHLLRRLPRLALYWPLHKPAALGGLAIATAYSLVAGWSVPTQRTLVMLAVVVLAQCSERRFPPFQVLLMALVAVLLFSPLAVHAAGFWLSFGAVALLMLGGGLFRHLPLWRQALALQLLLSLLLLPLTVWFFERASWVSPFANLLAVPLVSFVVVPLGLLGLLAWLCNAPALAELCWRWGADLIALLDALLAQFQAWPFASVSVGLPDLFALLLFCLLLFCLCQPLRRRWCWLALPLACCFLLPRPTVPQGVLRVTVLDVGQGLSVLLETREHSLLYDSGPALGPAADAGGRIVLPALHQLHRYRLDVLLLSHDDNDHTGGAATLLQQMPVARGLGVKPRGVVALPPWQDCAQGQAWEWEGWTFRLLHPVAGESAGSDNNRSCVLRVSRGQAAVLLPGDLEQVAEQDVLRRHRPGDLQADLLVLGHHGSRNASSPDWLAAVRPRWAIASAGYRNRFRHPSPALLQRLRDAGIPWRNTAESGALVAELDSRGLRRLQGFREHAGHYWQHDEAQAFFCESTDTDRACGALGGTPLNR